MGSTFSSLPLITLILIDCRISSSLLALDCLICDNWVRFPSAEPLIGRLPTYPPPPGGSRAWSLIEPRHAIRSLTPRVDGRSVVTRVGLMKCLVVTLHPEIP
jgi:hypothetical protein